jgi:hypothetical protein
MLSGLTEITFVPFADRRSAFVIAELIDVKAQPDRTCDWR